MAVRLNVNLTEREAEALLRSQIGSGWGVRRTQAQQTAEFKIRGAIINVLHDRDFPEGYPEGNKNA